MSHTILDQLSDYADWLIQEERSAATAEKYLRSLRRFALWLNERPLCKTNVLAWRAHLQEEGYAPGTINTMLAALHSYFRFADITDCSVKYLRVQRSLFRDSDRALSLDDYHRLVRAAHSTGQHQLALIIETICATGRASPYHHRSPRQRPRRHHPQRKDPHHPFLPRTPAQASPLHSQK